MCKEPEKKATSVRVLLPFSLYASFVHKIGTIDCVHAEGLAFMNTLSIVLYLFSQHVGHLMSHLIEKVFTHCQLQNVSLG